MPGTSRFALAQNTVQCPKCRVAAGERCVLTNGRPASSVHNERLQELRRREQGYVKPTEQPFMGLAELADYLGWSKQRLSMRLKRHPEEFPEPVAQLALGPCLGY